MFRRRKQRIILTLITFWLGTSIVRGAGFDDANFLKDVASFFSLIVDVIYVLLWPLLVVAGWALDNSLVMGEVLHLDKALWQFWIIMRNLANFALGFIVLWMIAKHLWGKGSEKEIISTIGKALIAGIGIQVSRFVMKALLDISTIAIYAVGAMPLSTLPQATDKDARPIIKPIITMSNASLNGHTEGDAGKKSKDFLTVAYQCEKLPESADKYTVTDSEGKPLLINNKKQQKKRAIDKCLIHDGFIIARRPYDADITYENHPINHNYCVFQQHIIPVTETENSQAQPSKYFYIPLYEYKEGKKPTTFTGSQGLGVSKSFNFEEQEDREAKKYEYLTKQIKNNSITKEKCTTTLSSLVKKGKGMTGVLTTIFSSILRFGDIATFGNNDNLGRVSISFFIRALFGVMLIAPLIVLALSLIKRVGYLWIAMVGGPLIVLFATFGKDLNIKPPKGMEILNIGEVIGLIFMPVITIFAMSLGIVFLSTLDNSIRNDTFSTNKQVFEGMGVQETKKDAKAQCYDIFSMDLCFEGGGAAADERNSFLDHFSWTMMMFFGMGVMWMIVFASFGASSVSKGLGNSVNELGRKLALNVPVIPIGAKNGKLQSVGLGSLGVGGRSNQFLSEIQTKLGHRSRNDARALMDKFSPKNKNPTVSLDKNITKEVFAAITPSPSGTVTAPQLTTALNGGTIKPEHIKAIEAAINAKTNKTKSIMMENGNGDTFIITQESDTTLKATKAT